MAVGCKITSHDIKTIILDHTKNSRNSSKKFGKQIENEIQEAINSVKVLHFTKFLKRCNT
jgi:hypothetical protein